jgi:hypothetical protein
MFVRIEQAPGTQTIVEIIQISSRPLAGLKVRADLRGRHDAVVVRV